MKLMKTISSSNSVVLIGLVVSTKIAIVSFNVSVSKLRPRQINRKRLLVVGTLERLSLLQAFINNGQPFTPVLRSLIRTS